MRSLFEVWQDLRGRRENRVEDIVKRKLVISPENVKLENFPIQKPVAVFNPSLLLENGESILTFWMTKVFCFEETRLTIKIPKRLSPVDSQIIAQYTYSKPELKIIKEVLQQYDLSDYDEIKAATTIFSNSLKTISQFLSKVFNTEYKIFTNKLDSKQKKGQLIINYEAAGRIQGF